MKVFIAQPMNGRKDEDVLRERDNVFTDIINSTDEPVQLIDQFHVEDAPENAGRIWYLGRSIMKFSEADVVYFAGKWWKANGCIIERLVCFLYNVPVKYVDYENLYSQYEKRQYKNALYKIDRIRSLFNRILRIIEDPD